MAELNDALRVISDLGRVLEQTAKDYKSSVGDVARLYANTKRGADKRNEQAQEANYNAVKKTTDRLTRLYKKTAEWEAETKMYTKATKQTANSLKSYARDMKLHGPANMSDELKVALDALIDSTDLTTTEMEDFQKVIRKHIDSENKIAGVEKRKVLRTKNINESFERLRDKTIGLGVSFDRIKSGLVGAIDELEYAQAHQISTYGILDQGLESFSKKMQMAPKSFQEMINQNKALVLSTGKNYNNLEGATGQFVNSMSRAGKAGLTLTEQAIRLTGNSDKAAKLMGASMEVMASIGVKLSPDELQEGTSKLMTDFQALAQISGKSSEEIAGMTNRFLDSSAIREKIGQLQGKQERIAFHANLRADLERNKKLGISFEQTFKMAEQMATFGQADVVDRMKGTAVAGMLAAQIGMSADDASFIQQKGAGIKNASPEDQARWKTLMVEFKKKLSEAKGSGNTGLEAVVNNLEKQLGPMKTVIDGAESVSETGKQLTDKQVKAAQSQDSNLGKQTQILADIKNSFDTNFKAWYADPGVKIIGGAAGAAVSGVGSLLTGAVGGAAVAAAAPAMVATATAAVGTAMAAAANLAIPAAMIAGAGYVGYELGDAVAKPIADWGSNWIKDLTGWDAMDTLGNVLVSTAALAGVESAQEIKAMMAQTEAANKQTTALNSSEVATAKLWQTEMDKRSANKGKVKTSPTLEGVVGGMDPQASRTSLAGVNAKRKSSLKQLESSIPKGIDYKRIPELENMKSSSAITPVEIAEQTRLLEEQLKMLRELIEASKGTTGAVSKMHQFNKDDSKEKRDAKTKSDEDAQNQIDLINSMSIG